MRFKKKAAAFMFAACLFCSAPAIAAGEVVHVTTPNLGSNFYFSADTNSWSLGQAYSAGCGAQAAVAHPNGTRIYTVTFCFTGFGFLSVFNLTHVPPTQVTVLSQGSHAFDADITKTGAKVYIPFFNANQVGVLDTATNTFDTPIAVNTGPYGIKIAPNDEFAYVTHFSAGTVSRINLNTNTVVGDPILSGPGAFEIAFTPDSETAFVTNSSTNSPGTVTAIDVSAGGGFKVITVGNGPSGIAMMPDGSKAYVADRNSWTVSVISMQGGTCLVPEEDPPCLSATIPTASAPYDVAITADGTTVYVTNNGAQSTQAIDTATDTISQTIAMVYVPNSQPTGITIAPPPDSDGDGVVDASDNCVSVPNPGQENYDGDALGDACDPDDDNDGQTDEDELACGSQPQNEESLSPDYDNDNSPDCVDEDDDNDGQTDVDELACGSLPMDENSKSPDNDEDGSPDCVDPDDDNDGVNDDVPDNCPFDYNPLQRDIDNNGIGDVCDEGLVGGGQVSASVGGVIETGNGGVILAFDPGDLPSDTEIGVAGAEFPPNVELGLSPAGLFPETPDGGAPPDYDLGELLVAYNFSPSGLVFDSPVSLTMSVDVTGLNGVQRAAVDIYFRQPNGRYTPLSANCTVSEPEPAVFEVSCVAEIPQFYVFALIAPRDSDNDGVFNRFNGIEDNCPMDYNPDQSDVIGNGLGDVCDPAYIFHGGFEQAFEPEL